MNATKRFRFIGEIIIRPAGRYTVTIQWLRDGAYRTEVRSGSPSGTLVEQLSQSYPTEDIAVAIGNVLRVAFRDNKTPEQARRAVVDHIDASLAFITAGPGAARHAETLQGLKARFASADDDARDADLIARINGHLGRAA